MTLDGKRGYSGAAVWKLWRTARPGTFAENMRMTSFVFFIEEEYQVSLKHGREHPTYRHFRNSVLGGRHGKSACVRFWPDRQRLSRFFNNQLVTHVSHVRNYRI